MAIAPYDDPFTQRWIQSQSAKLGAAPSPTPMNPLFQTVRADVQAQQPQENLPQLRPYQGVHERYQPLIDNLMRQSQGLYDQVNAPNPMAMQPNEPIRNLMRGLSMGLDAYNQGIQNRLDILAGNRGRGGVNAIDKRKQQAEDHVLDMIKSQSDILTTLAQMENYEQSAYQSHGSAAKSIGGFYNDRAIAPYDAYQKATAGEENLAQAGNANARTRTENQLRGPRENEINQGAFSHRQTGLNAAARTATENQTRPGKVAIQDARQKTEEAEAESSGEYYKQRAANEKRKAETPVKEKSTAKKANAIGEYIDKEEVRSLINKKRDIEEQMGKAKGKELTRLKGILEETETKLNALRKNSDSGLNIEGANEAFKKKYGRAPQENEIEEMKKRLGAK